MSHIGKLAFTFAAFAIFLLMPRPASGACLALQDGSVRCGDSCGSMSVYVCSFGCAWGTCTTGYGVCCGVDFRTQGIARDPDPQPCGECGYARTRSPRSVRSTEPNTIRPGATTDHRVHPTSASRLDSLPYQLIYTPDRCARSYATVDPTVFSRRNGGS